MLFTICIKHDYKVTISPWENFLTVVRTKKCGRCLMGL